MKARGNAQPSVDVAPGTSERIWVDNWIRSISAYNRVGLVVQMTIDPEDLRF